MVGQSHLPVLSALGLMLSSSLLLYMLHLYAMVGVRGPLLTICVEPLDMVICEWGTVAIGSLRGSKASESLVRC